MTTTLYLMRHGEVHNPQAILYGRLPGYRLSEAGIDQARAAGKWLADRDIRAIYCSPMQRARQTAGIVADYTQGISPVVDERIIEVSTPYEGHPTEDLAQMGWDLYTGNQPPHETPQLVLARVLDFLDFLRVEHQGGSVAAVGHGDILVFPWLHAQGIEPEAHLKDRLRECGLPVAYPATASIMRFEISGNPRATLPTVSYFCPY